MDAIIVVNFQKNDVLSTALHSQIKEYAWRNEIEFQDDTSSADKYTLAHRVDATYPLIISIGGDGTLLSAANLALRRYPDHAIFPINTGRLGFLTNGRKFNGFEKLEQALDAIIPLSLWAPDSEVEKVGIK